MIYIIEGAHAVGKTTYAKSLGIEYTQCACSSLDSVKRAIINMWGRDIACDRLFLLPLKYKQDGDTVAKEVNDFLKYYQDMGYLKCLMLTCDKAEAWERERRKENPVTKEEFDSTWDFYEHMIPLCDNFEIIDTTGEVKS